MKSKAPMTEREFQLLMKKIEAQQSERLFKKAESVLAKSKASKARKIRSR